MKRERALQVVLVLVGLFYCFWGYLLFDDLWHSRWLSGHSDVMPMFLSLNTALGVCLLVAVNQPAKHRLMIAYGASSSLAHGFTMTIMSAQAVAHGNRCPMNQLSPTQMRKLILHRTPVDTADICIGVAKPSVFCNAVQSTG
jgi:hypothetical protein